MHDDMLPYRVPRKERDLRMHTKKMKTLFEAADESGDGVVATSMQCRVPASSLC